MGRPEAASGFAGSHEGPLLRWGRNPLFISEISEIGG